MIEMMETTCASVTNLDQGSIVKVPVDHDGSAGAPSEFVRDDRLTGADGVAFDTRGNLYVEVNAQNAIRRIFPEGDIETLVSNEMDDFDRFDFPTNATFGTSRGAQKSVFITNLAFSDTPDPTFMKLHVGVPGLPIHR